MTSNEAVTAVESVTTGVDTGVTLSSGEPSRAESCAAGRWDGTPLLPPDLFVAFRVGTDAADPTRTVPGLTAAAADAGGRTVVIHPDEVGRFVLAHRHLRWACHDAALDFWVVEHHLRCRGVGAALEAWWEIVDGDRLHDPMLLDMLVRLARDDSDPTPRDLVTLARALAGVQLPANRSIAEPGSSELLIPEVTATRAIYLALRKHAIALTLDFGRHNAGVFTDARSRFGLLTEAVQVKKAIALAAVTRNGMRLDRDKLRGAEGNLRLLLRAAVTRVRAACPALYRTNREGKLVRAGTGGSPTKDHDVLRARLVESVAHIERESGVAIEPAFTKDGDLSTTPGDWAEYRDRHPFLRDWLEVEETAQTLQFFHQLPGETVHPRYTVLVRTGRTSCAGPNVQQVPRAGGLREAFVASPGYLLLSVDYAAAELRALAAHCRHRFGRSALADVLAAGADPHAHTAALILGVPTDEFLAWKTGEGNLPKKFAAARQAAKAINFGVPGGLGAEALREYARARFGVVLTADDARRWRERLTTEVYPELALYLADDAATVLARNLHAPVGAVARNWATRYSAASPRCSPANRPRGMARRTRGRSSPASGRAWPG